MLDASFLQSLNAPYLYSRHLRNARGAGGGCQALILHDIAACFDEPSLVIWVPFYCDGLLVHHLESIGHTVIHDADVDMFMPDHFPHMPIDGLYFGTPTIVNNEPLFPTSVRPFVDRMWTASYERATVRAIVTHATLCGATCIVSGLGSGDISVEQRQMDMGGWDVQIACIKAFRGFTDYVLVRRTEHAT